MITNWSSLLQPVTIDESTYCTMIMERVSYLPGNHFRKIHSTGKGWRWVDRYISMMSYILFT